MTEKPWKHIGDSDCFSKLDLWWRRVPLKVEIKIELINFYKSEARSYNDGAYHEFAAYCHEEVPSMGLDKGDYFTITFPYITLYRAIQPLPFYVKKMIKRSSIGNDNIFIRFIKDNKQVMTILEFERRAEDPEMTNKATELLYSGRTDDFPERRKSKKDETTESTPKS